MIPVQSKIPALRATDPEVNATLLNEEQIFSDEIREEASRREVRAKEKQAKQYNKHVCLRAFEVDDLVWRRADIGLKNAKEGKFARNWEGPYRVTSTIGSGGYRLETLTGSPIGNS